MINVTNKELIKHLFNGEFGLEKEGLRVTEDGRLSHTVHPFCYNPNIVRDFCENQTEINTPITNSATEAIKCLSAYTKEIKDKLKTLEPVEYLWPFSNPPYLFGEEDIPIAKYYGDEISKTEYREYLSKKYGRYKMTFSGIHINFSFNNELLEADFKYHNETDFQDYKNRLYLDLAERVVAYGWILVAISAASPLTDISFSERNKMDEDKFFGMASMRASELGYWNYFTPVMDYTSLENYIKSIEKYVASGEIIAPSELYYPVRLKPKGSNTLENLTEKGINHIELRMFDLNPLAESGLELKDVQFAQLFLTWLASTPRQKFDYDDQMMAVKNFKSAACYDLDLVNIYVPNGEVYTVNQAGKNVIGFMKEFYAGLELEDNRKQEIKNILEFEEEKFINPETRYAWQVKNKFSDTFVKKGLEYVKRGK